MSNKVTWAKEGQHIYTATINGRNFVLRHNHRAHSRRRKNEFGFGSHRVSYSSTWYTVAEKLADGRCVPRYTINNIPGTLVAAKAMAVSAAYAPALPITDEYGRSFTTCPSDPGTAELFHCHDYSCPVHGQRNLEMDRK